MAPNKHANILPVTDTDWTILTAPNLCHVNIKSDINLQKTANLSQTADLKIQDDD